MTRHTSVAPIINKSKAQRLSELTTPSKSRLLGIIKTAKMNGGSNIQKKAKINDFVEFVIASAIEFAKPVSIVIPDFYKLLDVILSKLQI